jgi:hypothetical protein
MCAAAGTQDICVCDTGEAEHDIGTVATRGICRLRRESQQSECAPERRSTHVTHAEFA